MKTQKSGHPGRGRSEADRLEEWSASSHLLARLNRIPVITKSHRLWTFLLAGAFLFELADVYTFGLVTPALKKHWHLSVSTVGLVTSLAFLGMFIGALTGGRLADRYGRKSSLVASILMFSGFSLLSSVAPNIVVLGIFRVLTGVGVTAMTVIALTYISEMYPSAVRGRSLTVTFGLGLVGIPVISWFARLVVPMGENGWRWVFILGGVGIIFGIAMIWLLPESIRWQAANGHSAEAEQLMQKLEGQAKAKYGKELPEPVVQTARPASGRVRELFSPQYRRRTIISLIVGVFTMMGFYGFNGWMPTLLVERGYDAKEALTFSSILAVAAIPGAMLFWPIVDRVERRYLAGGALIAVTVLIVIFGFSTSLPMMLVSGFLASMLLQSIASVMYVYNPEIFPTRLRAIGGGFGNGAGRAAAFATSNFLPVVFRNFGFAGTFVYIAAACLLAGVIVAIWGERTNGKTLEDISGEVGDEVIEPSPVVAAEPSPKVTAPVAQQV